jgi:hypothetical protein
MAVEFVPAGYDCAAAAPKGGHPTTGPAMRLRGARRPEESTAPDAGTLFCNAW